MRGLYAIIDAQACRRDPEAIALAVLRGGCAALQLRDKTGSDAEVVRVARVLASQCRAHGVPFILNDRFWLAPEVGAQGAHLGQTDHPIEEARQLLGPAYGIGLSTHTLEQARDAERRGADLIGFGPVFPTASKLAADPVVGLNMLRAVVLEVCIPVVAIGGVTLERAGQIARTGASLAAAISALCAARDPEQAARELHEKLTQREHA